MNVGHIDSKRRKSFNIIEKVRKPQQSNFCSISCYDVYSTCHSCIFSLVGF